MGNQTYGLYRVLVSVHTKGDGGPIVCYLVRSESPAAAADLAIDRAAERWSDYRSIEVLQCWSYPPGELVLAGADQLEMVGVQVPVVDLGVQARHAG